MVVSRKFEKPIFVWREGVIVDEDYVEWLSELKQRFRQSQVKAAVKVNTGMLEFYWSVGGDLVRLRAEERWGSGVVKQFSLDMRNAFPNETGFSYSNVKYMKQWYSFYFNGLAAQLKVSEKSHQAGGQLEMPEIFGRVPWKHHTLIVSKCESVAEALFYVALWKKGGAATGLKINSRFICTESRARR